MPEFTKPTTMTEVADEDCMTAVTPAPSSRPLRGVPESLKRMSSIWLPATFFRPSPMRPMPKRNSAMPPSRLIKSEISTCFSLFFPMVFCIMST